MLSIVVSVYNEEAIIKSFYADISTQLQNIDDSYELIFVNDGSSDESADIIRQFLAIDNNISLINFSRNYGHEAAMIAGIDHAKGDAVVCIDADLQHPPSELISMYACFKEDKLDIINMIRNDTKDQKSLGSFLSKKFYWFFNKVSHENILENASDFFLISKKVANILRKDFRERTRFLRGYTQIIGFKKGILYYDAPKRTAGESKYSYRSLLKLSLDAIFNFSDLPLRLGIYIGLLTGGVSFFILIYSVLMKLFGEPPSGYTTLIVTITFLFSILFILIGLIGEYIGLLFKEQKQRPLYIVDTIETKNPLV